MPARAWQLPETTMVGVTLQIPWSHGLLPRPVPPVTSRLSPPLVIDKQRTEFKSQIHVEIISVQLSLLLSPLVSHNECASHATQGRRSTVEPQDRPKRPPTKSRRRTQAATRTSPPDRRRGCSASRLVSEQGIEA